MLLGGTFAAMARTTATLNALMLALVLVFGWLPRGVVHTCVRDHHSDAHAEGPAWHAVCAVCDQAFAVADEVPAVELVLAESPAVSTWTCSTPSVLHGNRIQEVGRGPPFGTNA